ncbi:MAG TPA: CesD/SycD/LcrH family type III secretion system chaperone [Myxococcales bacterium]|jgi:type III secretion system low calcium response chaperone LcrH/SycD|nr:CesD/SycD/LcrH family type III secretion system chaperone [Myxococcales bacterium]
MRPSPPQHPDKLLQLVQKWAEGRATLKEVRGYSDEELYAVARVGHAFFHQGKVAQARTLFQGLFAINPRDPYFARALAVVEYAAGNPEGALSAYEVAVKLAPGDAAGYLGRAEVLLSMGQRQKAAEDLKRATRCEGDERLKTKAESLLDALRLR